MNTDIEVVDQRLRRALQSYPVAIAARSALAALNDDALEISEKMDAFYQAYDAFLALALDEIPMSCRSGCAHCCTDNPIGVTGAELEMISDWVVQQADAERLLEHITKGAFRYQEIVEQHTHQKSLAWKKLRHFCPFLGLDSHCRIYSIRPVACRMHFSITPSEWCEPAHDNFESSCNPQLELSENVHQRLQRISFQRGWVQKPTDLLSGLTKLLELKHGRSIQGGT